MYLGWSGKVRVRKMAENVEEIEAKLAAYVDGELTPAERVEIETHLQNNPSHRELLQDLVLHRNLLRGLPREKAPGDCTEGFQGQLERDILLGGDELARARRRWRIQYSPQLLSAAAIILVAVALGIIVYVILPAHQPNAPISQLSTEAAKSESAPTEITGTLADARSYKPAAPEVMSKKGAAGNSLALNEESLVQKLDAPRFAGFKTQAEEPIAASDMMVITVTADDVKSANQAVVSYLDLNKINYTAEAQGLVNDGLAAISAGRRLANGMSGPAGAGTPSQGGGGFAGGGADATAAAQLPALRNNLDDLAKRDDDVDRKRQVSERVDSNAAFKSAVVQEKQAAEQNVTAKDEPQREERFAKAAARPAPIHPEAKAPSTQPSATVLAATDPRGLNENQNGKLGESAAAGGVGGALGPVLLRQQEVSAVQQLADGDNAACVILARNMNGRQVRELTRSLSQPERNVYATAQLERSDTYGRSTLATFARSSDQQDHFLSYQRQPVDEKELMLREKVVAANAPAVVGPTTRPAEQPILSIKPSEAGLTRAETELNASVNAVAPNTTPNDFAFVQGAQQPQPAQQQGYFAIAPTTQPESTRAGRDLYTCVIVVQNTTATRAGLPTTQSISIRV